jgi:CRP-like cAMP-binding protein
MRAPGNILQVVSGGRSSRTNRLLSALPTGDVQRLDGQLQRRAVLQKQDLGEPGQRIDQVHFPVDAVVSILTRLDAGQSVEIATIGNEGLVGVTVVLGGSDMNPREVATVQVPGEVVSMNADAFRAELERGGALASLVERYTRAFFSQVFQQVACNGLHTLEQRCARWILLTRDRVDTDEFPMTHEFLAQMLGVRRASVTQTAGLLQNAGYVQFSRGRVRVADRTGLEGAACECYRVTREVYDRVFP